MDSLPSSKKLQIVAHLMVATQMVLEFCVIAMVVANFGTAAAAPYFVTLATVAIFVAVLTAGLHDYLILTRLSGFFWYINLALKFFIIGITGIFLIKGLIYAIMLTLGFFSAVLSKYFLAKMKLEIDLPIALITDAFSSVVSKLLLITALSAGKNFSAEDFGFFAAIFPALAAGIFALVITKTRESRPANVSTVYEISHSYFFDLYWIKMATQSFKRMDVLLINLLFQESAVTLYSVMKQILGGCNTIIGKIYTQMVFFKAASASRKKGNDELGAYVSKRSAESLVLLMLAIAMSFFVVTELPFALFDNIKLMLIGNLALYIVMAIQLLLVTRISMMNQVLKAYLATRYVLAITVLIAAVKLGSLWIGSIFSDRLELAILVDCSVLALFFLPAAAIFYKKSIN